jgi:hypothetical protein
MQNHITGLAIISGYILRDVYFSEQSSLDVLQRYQTQLQAWMANIPSQLKLDLELGVALDSPKDQTEAAVSRRRLSYRL